MSLLPERSSFGRMRGYDVQVEKGIDEANRITNGPPASLLMGPGKL